MARKRGIRIPKEKPTFKDAPNILVEMAGKILGDYHSHLREANIKYLVRTGKWEVRGRLIYGKASKASSQVKYLSGGYDFVVTINNDVWTANQDEKKRNALLDHVLCHCARGEDDKVTGEPKWYINQPTVSDFPTIIARRGLWTEGLEKLFDAKDQFEQMTIIPFDKAKQRTGTDN